MTPLCFPHSLHPVELPLDARRIVIIGANGAGKTRFARELAALSSPGTIPLNVLNALYTPAPADPADFFDALFLDSTIGDGEKARTQTRLERLLTLLLNDELIHLLGRKLLAHSAPGEPLPPDKPTRLDALIELFHDIFPDNSMLVEGGRFLFHRPGSHDRYPIRRLSDGERSVLYYAAAILYAPDQANIVVESPEIFLHPTTIQAVWNRLEILRPDCRWIFVTHDLEFAASRQGASIVWVRAWEPADNSYDYAVLDADSVLNENLYMDIMGARRDVLFIEGDSKHSIDAKLYPLLFKDFTVKSVGSCNRVIEATRTFNSLSDFHHMRATGIVDRDRRAKGEVDYLRSRNILVPDVAEVENFFLLEDVVRTVAADCGRDPDRVFAKVRRGIIAAFTRDINAQALEHARHTMKKTVEYRIDGRFNAIAQMEQHIARLCIELNPRGVYEDFCRQFHRMAKGGDYEGILRVYNHKTMIAAVNLPALCGLSNKDAYIARALRILARENSSSSAIAAAALRVLHASHD